MEAERDVSGLKRPTRLRNGSCGVGGGAGGRDGGIRGSEKGCEDRKGRAGGSVEGGVGIACYEPVV